MSEQATTPKPLEPGDKVSFTVVRQSGGGFRFSAREGKLIRICGANAEVKAKNGRTQWVATADLRPIGQPNAMTEAVLEYHKQNKQSEEGGEG